MTQIDYRELFDTVKTFAVVGYSDKPARAGHFVPAYLRQAGYNVIAVNPQYGDEVDGLPCYASLAEIPADMQVDVVDIFRAPQHLPGVLDDALAMAQRPRYFWMQPGAEHPETAAAAAEAGMTSIMHACALAEHKKLGQ